MTENLVLNPSKDILDKMFGHIFHSANVRASNTGQQGAETLSESLPSRRLFKEDYFDLCTFLPTNTFQVEVLQYVSGG